jgi:predicted Zn finger-like uncharacterized protein
MIVRCEQCQTRFKIPDDKVTERGVKVRCTKCGSMFRAFSNGTVGPADAVAPAPDPFANFGRPAEAPPLESTTPGTFALGIEATRNPRLGIHVPLVSVASGFASSNERSWQSVPLRSPPMPGAPNQMRSAPSQAIQNISLPNEQSAAPGGFDFSSFAATDAKWPALTGAAPAATAAAFDFSSLGEPAAEPHHVIARPSPQPASGAGAFDFSSLDASSGPASSPFDFTALGPPGAAPPVASTFQFSALDSIPAKLKTPVPPRATPAHVIEETERVGEAREAAMVLEKTKQMPVSEARNALFDMAAALPPPPEDEPVIALPPPQDDAPKVALGRVSAPRPLVSEAANAPSPRRKFVRVMVNSLMGLFLVAGGLLLGTALLNEGRFSLDTGSQIQNPHFPVSDISNGLYGTVAGRPLFFVRGHVENKTELPAALMVKAEIVEGNTLLRGSEVRLGRAATPAELFALNGAEAGRALTEKLAAEQPLLAAKSGTDFLVIFFEYPPELQDFRVRVSANPAPAPRAANP